MAGLYKMLGHKQQWVDTKSSHIIFDDKKREIKCEVDVKKPIGNPVREKFTIKYEDFICMTINGEVFGRKTGNAFDWFCMTLAFLDPDTTPAEFAMETSLVKEKRFVYGESFTFTFMKDGKRVSKEIWFREISFTKYNYDYVKGRYYKMQNWIHEHLKEMGVECQTEKNEEKVKKPSTEMDVVKALREYKKLLDDGIITEEQFNHKRDELMS